MTYAQERILARLHHKVRELQALQAQLQAAEFQRVLLVFEASEHGCTTAEINEAGGNGEQ